MFSSQDVSMNYILHKSEIHQVGPITAENKIKRNTNEHKGATQYTAIAIGWLSNYLTQLLISTFKMAGE